MFDYFSKVSKQTLHATYTCKKKYKFCCALFFILSTTIIMENDNKEQDIDSKQIISNLKVLIQTFRDILKKYNGDCVVSFLLDIEMDKDRSVMEHWQYIENTDDLWRKIAVMVYQCENDTTVPLTIWQELKSLVEMLDRVMIWYNRINVGGIYYYNGSPKDQIKTFQSLYKEAQ